jgi:chromosome condensin MukBEF ATPase and DNA-binding subunit MukB
MKSSWKYLIAGLGLLVAAGSAEAQGRQSPRDTANWRTRMQQNQNAAQSIEQQVSRLTKDLELTPDQQKKVRTLAWEHHDRIQKILDTAPPTLTRAEFTTQVHGISQDFHNSVNALLTPHQTELMKSMLHRLDTGTERRRAP